MRKKNRQFKITVDIPEEFESDEDFAYALQDTMDATEWKITVHNEAGEQIGCPVKKVNYMDFELVEDEEEEEE